VGEALGKGTHPPAERADATSISKQDICPANSEREHRKTKDRKSWTGENTFEKILRAAKNRKFFLLNEKALKGKQNWAGGRQGESNREGIGRTTKIGEFGEMKANPIRFKKNRKG